MTNKFPSQLIKINNESVETVFVRIEIKKKYLIIGSSYIPPRSSLELYQSYVNLIDFVLDKYPVSTILLTGDFNFPFLNWIKSDSSNHLHFENSSEISNILLNAMAYHELFQINHLTNYLGRILDLIFVNSDDAHIEAPSGSLLPVDNHHPPLVVTVQFRNNSNITVSNEKRKIRSFKKTRFDQFNEYLSKINWDYLCDLSLEMQIKSFYETVNIGIENFVPFRTVDNFKFPIWFSPELKNKILLKKSLHKKYKETNSIDIYNQFTEVRRECKSLTYITYKTYIKSTEKEIRKNPKKIYSFINSKKQNNELPSRMFLENINANNNIECANLFAAHFSSVFSNEQIPAPNIIYEKTLPMPISSFQLSTDTIYQKMCKLPPVTSCGPDNVPPILLKSCAAHLAIPLTTIFNKSLESGHFPHYWKTSYVTPTFKKGDKTNVKNFRPISKNSAIPKLLEALINDVLQPLFSEIIVDNQHGFMKNKSTSSNLISFFQCLTPYLEDGDQVDCIETDFSSAFDLVNINILCSKLGAMGITDPLLSWFRSYLSTRTQIIKYNNVYSEPYEVNSSCPQGGHLSGLLFNIYINDLISYINHDIHSWLFADDFRMCRVVRGTADREALQASLDSLVLWCEANRMKLNVAKCLVLSFHRKKCPLRFDYTINDDQLKRVSQVTDLGVVIDHDLKFNAHYQNITNKAFRNLGFLYRNSREFESPDTLRVLYYSLVRSTLEYCSPLWSPSYHVHINLIESVQRKFSGMLAYKANLDLNNRSYNKIIKHFNIQTLKDRREIADIMFILKLLRNKIKCNELHSLIEFRQNTKGTRNNDVFKIKKYNTNIGKNNTLNRCLSICNKLANPPYNIDLLSEHLNIESLKHEIPALFALHPN